MNVIILLMQKIWISVIRINNITHLFFTCFWTVFLFTGKSVQTTSPTAITSPPCINQTKTKIKLQVHDNRLSHFTEVLKQYRILGSKVWLLRQ